MKDTFKDDIKKVINEYLEEGGYSVNDIVYLLQSVAKELDEEIK